MVGISPSSPSPLPSAGQELYYFELFEKRDVMIKDLQMTIKEFLHSTFEEYDSCAEEDEIQTISFHQFMKEGYDEH